MKLIGFLLPLSWLGVSMIWTSVGLATPWMCPEVLNQELPATAPSNYVYFTPGRLGQSMTYNLLKDFIKGEDSSIRVMGFEDVEKTRQDENAKVMLLNFYQLESYDVPYLQRLALKGVRMMVDVEITGEQHLHWINRMAISRIPKSFELVTGSKTILEGIQKRWPEFKITLVPHLENLYFRRDPGPAERALQDWNPADPRLLFIQQQHYAGTQFLMQLFQRIDSRPPSNLKIVIALHPHTADRLKEFIVKNYGHRADVKIFESSPNLKTNDFLLQVDGAISQSSTLIDVAREAGIPTMTGFDNKKLKGFEEFLEKLDPSSRSERRHRLQQLGEDAFQAWLQLLTNLPR
jgi:hypothetical protein